MRLAFVGRGGSGKTAITALSAYTLSISRPAIVLDADPTTAKLTSMLISQPPAASLIDFLLGHAAPKDILIQAVPAKTFRYDLGKPPTRLSEKELKKIQLFIIPSKVSPNSVNEIARLSAQDILEKFCELWNYVESLFDDPLMLIDTPAGTHVPLSSLAVALAAFSDRIIPVIVPDRNTVVTTAKAVEALASAGISPLAIILNRYDEVRPLFYDEESGKYLSWTDYVSDHFGMDPIVVPADEEFRMAMASDLIPYSQILYFKPTRELLRSNFVKMLLKLKSRRPRCTIPESLLLHSSAVEDVFAPPVEGEGSIEEVIESLRRGIEGEAPPDTVMAVRTGAQKLAPEREQKREDVDAAIKRFVGRIGESKPTEDVILRIGGFSTKVKRDDVIEALDAVGAPKILANAFYAEEVDVDSLIDENPQLSTYIKEALKRLGIPLPGTMVKAEATTRAPRAKEKEGGKGLLGSIKSIFSRASIELIYPDGSKVSVPRKKFINYLNIFGLQNDAKFVEEAGSSISIENLPSYGDARLGRVLAALGAPRGSGGRITREIQHSPQPSEPIQPREDAERVTRRRTRVKKRSLMD